MRGLLVTYHQVYNYGSSLQAYATKTTLEKLGSEVDILNYTPERYRNYGSVKQMFREKRYFHPNFIKCAIVSAVSLPSRWKQKKVFRKFDPYIDLGKEVFRHDLESIDKEYDYYLTGSDQVWNNHFGGFDEVFFLEFAKSNPNCFAYAASFGKDAFSAEDTDKLRPYLKKYKRISVREHSGLDILEAAGTTGIQLIDPVYTLSVAQWRELFSKRVVNKKYILVYQLNSGNRLIEKALQLKELYPDSEVVVIEYERRKRAKNVKYISLPTVNEFLSLFFHASYVVTDSFHGTSFSILFNVPFFVTLPPSFHGRIESILSLFGLQNRVIDASNTVEMIARNAIPWEQVNLIKQNEVQKSIGFLKRCLEDCRE